MKFAEKTVLKLAFESTASINVKREFRDASRCKAKVFTQSFFSSFAHEAAGENIRRVISILALFLEAPIWLPTFPEKKKEKTFPAEKVKLIHTR